jgi:Pilus formation protein N terminal region
LSGKSALLKWGEARRRFKRDRRVSPSDCPRREVRGQRTFMNLIYNCRTRNLRWLPVGILVLTSLFVAEVKLYGQADKIAADTESVVVYPIAVTVNKAVVLRLPKRATRVSVTQPEIAEAVVVAPNQILINGKAVGATSLVVWFEDEIHKK